MNDLFDAQDREIYREAIQALKDVDVDFMVGGAFAVYYYTGWWRNTHDIDVYVIPEDVERAANALDKAGFKDLGEQAPGDREWIYHAGTQHIIFDVIFRFANFIQYITPDWLERAPKGEMLGTALKIMPVEELIWIKTFVINRHRCDWPDIMRIIRYQCRNIDWERLLQKIGDDWLLLAGLIDVFDWQTPGAMDCIPDSIREELARRRIEYRSNPVMVEREHLLDPWLHQRADSYAIWRNE